MDALNGTMEVDKPDNHRDLYKNAKISADVLIGEEVEMGEGVVIGERSIIGDSCVIGKNASLRDCVVLGGSRIEDGAVLHNCIYAFGEHVAIDPLT
jgi:NDP-sugar pyrophosphorylase family protein